MEDYIRPEPSSLADVLSRFKADFEKPKNNDLSLSRILNLYAHRDEGPFVNEVTPKECPSYTLVVAGALLTKVVNPGEIQYLDEILCGRFRTHVDDLGPLSGRKGTEYKPLSQCWRTAVELEELVDFMEKKESMPASPASRASEDEKRKILNKRYGVQERNGQRQMVFTNWSTLRPAVSSLLAAKKDNQLKLPVTIEISNETALVKQSLDVYAQINVGGPEYRELTDWANQKVLTPLKDLLGKDHFYYRTAENCPKAPKRHFFGVMS
jgi:hypothetical protein